MPQGVLLPEPERDAVDAARVHGRSRSPTRSATATTSRTSARLKPGATVQQAQQQVDALNAANLERFPQYKELLINAGFHTTVERLQDKLVRDIKATLYLMWGGALFVLLIGCVNVANLVLVRSRARDEGAGDAAGARRRPLAGRAAARRPRACC